MVTTTVSLKWFGVLRQLEEKKCVCVNMMYVLNMCRHILSTLLFHDDGVEIQDHSLNEKHSEGGGEEALPGSWERVKDHVNGFVQRRHSVTSFIVIVIDSVTVASFVSPFLALVLVLLLL
jgi:hypothetical protein